MPCLDLRAVAPESPFGQPILSPQRLPFRHPAIVGESYVLKHYALLLSVPEFYHRC